MGARGGGVIPQLSTFQHFWDENGGISLLSKLFPSLFLLLPARAWEERIFEAAEMWEKNQEIAVERKGRGRISTAQYGRERRWYRKKGEVSRVQIAFLALLAIAFSHENSLQFPAASRGDVKYVPAINGILLSFSRTVFVFARDKKDKVSHSGRPKLDLQNETLLTPVCQIEFVGGPPLYLMR